MQLWQLSPLVVMSFVQQASIGIILRWHVRLQTLPERSLRLTATDKDRPHLQQAERLT